MSRPSSLAFALLCLVALAGAVRADAPAGDATVPDCVGLDVTAAEALAKNAGFLTTLTYGAPGAAGTVVSQEPGGLSVRPAGGTLTLKVAGPGAGASEPPAPPPPSLPPTPPVPEAPPAGTGPSPMDDLPPPTVRPPTDATPPADVPSTAPVAPPTTGVDVDALPVDPLPNTQGAAVPSVLGNTREQAQAKLGAWKVEVEMIFSSPDGTGRVVEQFPKPTSTLADGETVTIVLGTTEAPGPEHRQVPELMGLSADDAVAVLKKVGFEPVLRATASTAANRGKVVAQTPKRFSFAQRGLGVRVTVGRGGLDGPAPVVPPAPAPGDPPAGPPPPVDPPTDVPSAPPAPPVPETPPAPPTPPPTPEPPPAPPGPPPAPPKPAPGPVTLVGPADSENYPRAYGANFEWRTVPNADGYEWELQQESGGGWRPARTEKLIGTKFRPARMEVGRYRWRVRALSGETPGAWSDFRLLYLY